MTDLAGTIIRSKRRTIALIITEDATLEIRAPFRTSLATIQEFVAKKRSWIEQKKDLIKKRRACILPKKFADDENFLYEGRPYRLQSADIEYITLSSDALYFPRRLLPHAKHYLLLWYKKVALEKIIERTSYYAEIARLQYKVVKITNAKSSWGSCSAKGSLNINWRLIMAPSEILDYVVVHELVHLVERNHSKSFWYKVQVILPNYKEYENWLKHHGVMLLVL